MAFVLIVFNLMLGLLAGDYNVGSAALREKVKARQQASIDRRTEPAVLDALSTELDAAKQAFEPTRKRTAWHRLVGILAALVGILVQCIAVTYFIGTARWCKEVVEAYGFEQDLIARSAALKRQAFPWSLVGILTLLGIVALGAAADPATLRATTADWVVPHFWAAMLGTGVVAFCLLQQVGKIHQNNGLVREITEKVTSERARRGLDAAVAS